MYIFIFKKCFSQTCFKLGYQGMLLQMRRNLISAETLEQDQFNNKKGEPSIIFSSNSILKIKLFILRVNERKCMYM